MHDPMTVAHEIKSPVKDKNGYRRTLLTVWHKDPCKDGTDDSCGWFKRARHGNSAELNEVEKEFAFNFKHNYWFDKDGFPIYNAISTLLLMYQAAAWIVFKRNRRKLNRFMKNHLYEITMFAANPHDSMHPNMFNKYGRESDEYRIKSFASVIYGDILRKNQKWYQHPRWHFWHWKIQISKH